MRKLVAVFPIFLVIISFVFFSQTGTGCKKDAENKIDSVTPPPPPPVPDTITYVKKIEETFQQGNPNQQSRTRDYSFYYDNLKRLTRVGIKNYGPVLHDSLTTRFFYNSSSKYPYMIIMPNVNASSLSGPAYYDTTWITYGINNLVVKDSSTDWTYNHTNSSLEHRLPLVRTYTYPNTRTVKIDWSATVGWNSQIDVFRSDSVATGADSMLVESRSVYYYDHNIPGSYTKAEAILPSATVNPLSKLNISGTIFSMIYSPTKEEILGSRFHWVVYTGNPLPYYLDFCSKWLPNSFFLTSYNRLGSTLGPGGIAFWTEITPWPQRSSYPQEINVYCSYSLPGNKFIYRYYYY